jgi:hypothetical protein
MTTLVLLHTGLEVCGTQESEYGYWLLEVTHAVLLGVFQVTLFCPVCAEQVQTLGLCLLGRTLPF